MKEFLGVGIAGNFADHLEQAGEADGFKNIKSDEEGAPKGIFPFHVPHHPRLQNYCFNNHELVLPENYEDKNIQAEPEIGLECEIIYEGNLVKSIVPKFFMAFNDASVRKDPTATKISEKKNFSTGSKALGNKIAIDKFSAGGICDNYSIVSFVQFDGELHLYGKCSPLTTYSYFYEQLLDWVKRKFNTQKDEFALEDFREILAIGKYPKNLILAIGATCYTEIGEKRFLREGDEVCIVVFNHNQFTLEQIQSLVKSQEQHNHGDNISMIRQKVVKAKL